MKFKFILPLAGSMLLSSMAFAQSNTANTSVPVKTTIYSPITVTKTSDLSFGDVYTSSAGGTVVMTPAGARSQTLGAGLSVLTGGMHTTASAGQVIVTGLTDAIFTLTGVPTSINLSGPSGATMVVDNIQHDLGGSSGTLTGGSIPINFGATLHVGSNSTQTPGAYSGNFTVTVTYN